jgi:hypothetical protein
VKVEEKMRRLLMLFAVGLAALLLVPGALAATPTQIYRDYADNGRLDGHYTRDELSRALKDAVLQGYPQGNTQPGFQHAVANAGAQAAGGGLPFTGLDLTLMVVGGTALLVVGAGLRRFGRSRA